MHLTRIAVVLCLALTLVSCGRQDAPESEQSLSSDVQQLRTAKEDLGGDYDRSKFRHWIDADGDGCDARREVLIRDSLTEVEVSGNCHLEGGRWHSWFDDVTTTDLGRMSVDHMIPLHEAWQSGAREWDAQRRSAFANDLDHPETLTAVTRESNSRKSDRDPADWVPGHEVCRYVSDWVTVKLTWDLSADEREMHELRRLAHACGARTQ